VSKGSLWLVHEGIELRAEWEGGEALSIDQFVRATDAMTNLWSALSGRVSGVVPASALTYHTGAEDES
jgi:hypothetical protein